MTPAMEGMVWVVAKVTVVAALALFGVWLARGSRAAVRHAFLAAAFGVMLLLPIASFFVPPVHVTVPVVVESRASTVEQIQPVVITENHDIQAIAVRQSSGISLSHLALTTWLIGVAIFLFPLAIGLWQIRVLRRSGSPWPRGESLARDAGVHRRIEVLLHGGVPGPMTCGIVRPTILLPRDAEGWNEDDLSRAFIHELEHVRRGDFASTFLARAACAVYWFHPLVWIAWRRLGLEAERSCDDAVLRRCEATAYADQLVDLARRLSAAQRSPLLAMANRSDLSTRVDAVLDGRQQRGRAGALVAFVCALAAVLIFAVSPLRMVAAARSGEKFEVASVRIYDPNSTVNTNDPGFRITHTVFPSNRLTMRYTNLRSLIREAYGVDYRYVVGPDWLDRQHYDLDAKVEGSARLTEEQMQPLVRNLLEERFHLRAHHAQKIVSGYALVVARGGARLQPNKGAPFMGIQGGYTLKFQNVSVTDFARFYLTPPVKGPVIDRTGIKGMYDFDLQFGPHDSDDPTFAHIPENLYANLPDIFTVLQEKYGLKLVPEKIAMDTLIIDHVDKIPTEN